MTNISYEHSDKDSQSIIKDYLKLDNSVIISKSQKNIDNIFSFNKNLLDKSSNENPYYENKIFTPKSGMIKT